MATNDELLSMYQSRDGLKAERDTVADQVSCLQKRLRTLDARIAAVRQVTDVVNNVCLRVDKDVDGRWQDAQTVADGAGVKERQVHLYQNVRNGHWVIRVNEVSDWQSSGYSRERWTGGHCVGLDAQFSYAQAETLAKRWLTEDVDIGSDGFID